MPVTAHVIEMFDDADTARRKMMEKVGPFLAKSNIRPVGQDILVAMYNRAGEKSAGGIMYPESYREDEFQGKVGLVLALGPECRGEKFDSWFGDEPPKVGSWIGMNIRDGMAFTIGGTTCRLVEWQYVRFITEAPDKAW